LLVARTLAAPAFPIPTSATPVTVVITGAVMLFVLFGSPVGELTVAALVMEPEAGAVTVRVRLLTCPLPNVPKFQLTTPAVLIPLPLALTNVTLAGSVSVTVTPPALDGP
jgi:O-antigen ligase